MGGFGRVWEGLTGFGRFWDLGGFGRVGQSGRVWKVLGRFGRVWEGLAGYNGAPKCLVRLGPPHDWYNWAPECLVQLGPRMSGTTGPPNGLRRVWKGLRKGLQRFGRFGKISKGLGWSWRVWGVLGGFGTVWEGFGRFGRVWDGVEGLGWFGRVWAGLGRFGRV